MAQTVVGLIHEADGRYGISFPDFPGVASGGATVDEAIARGRQILAFHVQGMIEDGDALPVLRSVQELRQDTDFVIETRDAMIVVMPVDLPTKPVRLNISLDAALLEAIDHAAELAGKTRSSFLADAARDTIMRRRIAS
jgi:predicted RNase H-like HicB family nuclease